MKNIDKGKQKGVKEKEERGQKIANRSLKGKQMQEAKMKKGEGNAWGENICVSPEGEKHSWRGGEYGFQTDI